MTATTGAKSRATYTEQRCVHCAHRIMDRDGNRYCDAPWPCRRGPVAYTGLDQLDELNLTPCPNLAARLLAGAR